MKKIMTEEKFIIIPIIVIGTINLLLLLLSAAAVMLIGLNVVRGGSPILNTGSDVALLIADYIRFLIHGNIFFRIGIFLSSIVSVYFFYDVSRK